MSMTKFYATMRATKRKAGGLLRNKYFAMEIPILTVTFRKMGSDTLTGYAGPVFFLSG